MGPKVCKPQYSIGKERRVEAEWGKEGQMGKDMGTACAKLKTHTTCCDIHAECAEGWGIQWYEDVMGRKMGGKDAMGGVLTACRDWALLSAL